MKKLLCYAMAMLTLLMVSEAVNGQAVSGAGVKKVDLKKKKGKNGNASTTDPVYTGTSGGKKISLGKKNEFLIIDWVKPGTDPIKLDNGYLDIKVKIFSPDVVYRENVTVFHNKERLGSKMDVSGLFGDQKEFNYTDRIQLVEGVNEIIVKVATTKQSKSSEPLIINRKGNDVSTEAMGAAVTSVKPTSSIYWWTAYDPVVLKGKPYTNKEKILPIKFKIITGESLNATQVRIMHNGKVLAHGKTSLLERDYQGNYGFADEVSLEEISGLNEIYLEVKTPSGSFKSEKLLVDYSPTRPNLHVLSVGTETNLQFTLKDARDFAKVFANQAGSAGHRIFNKILIDTLIGSAATAQEIKGTIEELKIRYFTGSISRDDVILAFISSHGFLMDGDFRLEGDDYSPARQRSTSVSFKNEVVAVLNDIPCKKIVMIDACHSGGARANSADINFEINKLNSITKGLTVFASSQGEEQSYEDSVWGNGAFTEAIIKGLSGGKADKDGNGIISLHELSTYVSKDVSAMVQAIKKRPQNPILVNDELGDVAIYVMDH